MTGLTTHVLDTTHGRPAEGVGLRLIRDGQVLVQARTNADGRVPDLLPPAAEVPPGVYRISFDTAEYMARCRAAHPAFFPDQPFYPAAAVQFQITPEQVRRGALLGRFKGRKAPGKLCFADPPTAPSCRRGSTSMCP